MWCTSRFEKYEFYSVTFVPTEARQRDNGLTQLNSSEMAMKKQKLEGIGKIQGGLHVPCCASHPGDGMPMAVVLKPDSLG